jgi:hypothetical protein
MKFEFISQFPVSRGTIIRDPAGVFRCRRRPVPIRARDGDAWGD